MRQLQRAAMLMICLVISIPFVFAQELSVQKFQGQDDAKGYARVQDEVTIEVLTQVPGEEIIDREQVRLYVGDSYAFFDECESTGELGFYTCTFFEPEFEAYEPITFTVELRDDDANIVGSETKTLVIDNQAPVVKEFTVDPALSSGPITVSYLAEDYSLTFGDTSECSGFKTIEIFSGNTVLANDTGIPGECIRDNVFDVTLTEAGSQQVCITATDQLNYQSAPICKEVAIDAAPPEIEDFSILDEQGFVITHVHQGEERIATITARITDDGEVDQSEVFANFKQLNPNLPDFIPPDVASGDLYSWRNIPVSEVSPCEITVKAKDTLGNEVTDKFSCDIKADDTPPTVLGITPDATRDGMPLYGYGTELIVEFEDLDNAGDLGIGMMSRKAYMDLREMGIGDFVQADICTHVSGAKWQCAWIMSPPAGIQEGNYTVVLSEGTSDDLDNVIGSSETYDIIFDHLGPVPPKIVDFKVISGEAGIEYEGGAVKGDYVQYTVRSGDFETATADFSQIGGFEETPPTVCDAVDNLEDCIFESLVDLSGPYTANISFDFYDDALNNASTADTLQVYGIDNETDAKYWKTPPDVTCSPKTIDRATASLIPPFATCRVDLETPRNDITTLAVAGPTSPDDCTGDVELNLNDIYVVNNAEGSKHPYLFMKLEPKNYYVDELNINCPIYVYSKRAVKEAGETLYYVSPVAQELPVNFTLKFYNNPLGDIHRSVDDKIENAFDKGLASQEWLGTLRKFLFYGELICYAKTLITNIIGALTTITIVLGITEDALKAGMPFTAPAVATAYQSKVTSCTTEETIAETYKVNYLDFLSPYCDVVNCASVSGKGAGIESYIGGGVPWCADIKNWLGQNLDLTKAIGLDAAAKEAGYATATGLPLYGVNVKESLILSTMCLCLPGIIHNLEKLRQIDCFEAVCLNDYVKRDGYPVSFCDDMHGYLTCTFVIGEIFSLLPFTAFFNAIIDMVLTVLTDPIALFTVALGAVCEIACFGSGSWEFAGCAILKTTSVIAEAVASVKTFQENKNLFQPIGNEYCERMEDIKDEFEESKSVI